MQIFSPKPIKPTVTATATPTPTDTAADPPPANSTTIHSRLVYQDKKEIWEPVYLPEKIIKKKT